MSPNFERSEFACQCGCGFDTVDYELVQCLEKLRAHFDRPIKITSGCRCTEHNTKVGGSPKTDTSMGSQHLYGRAADIQVQSVDPAIVYEVAVQIGFNGTGCYSTFTHCDTRDHKATWEGA